MTSLIDDNFKHSIIEHMNSDHADALVLYLKAYSKKMVTTEIGLDDSAMSITMTDIDETGITLQVVDENAAANRDSTDSNVNIKFSDAVNIERLTRAEDVRSVLVLMTKQARVLIESHD